MACLDCGHTHLYGPCACRCPAHRLYPNVKEEERLRIDAAIDASASEEERRLISEELDEPYYSAASIKEPPRS